MRLKRPDIERVVSEFEGWRARREGRAIPADLWNAAVGLLDRYSAATICRRLRLNQSRFKEEREARGRAFVGRRHGRGGARRGVQEAQLARRLATAAAAGPFVELPALGVALSSGPPPRQRAEGSWGPTGCRLTIESGRGTVTLVTAMHEAALADAVCRFVLGGLDGNSR